MDIMRRENKKIQARDLLVSLLGCYLEDMNYLIYLINKAQNRYKGDILDSIISGLDLDCASYNLRSVSDELFGVLGNEILANMVHEKMREGGRCVIILNGANVRDKNYNFDESTLESDYITDKTKTEIITDFNIFLEKFIAKSN